MKKPKYVRKKFQKSETKTNAKDSVTYTRKTQKEYNQVKVKSHKKTSYNEAELKMRHGPEQEKEKQIR